MPVAADFNGDVVIRGAVVPQTLVLPNNSVSNEKIPAGANIDADKLRHLIPVGYSQAPGSAVVAATTDVHIARGDGSVRGLKAAITGALADDASRHVTIDLQKSTGGGAFATVLTAVIDLDENSTLRTPVAATVNTAAYVAGDIFRFVVAVSGGSGNQGQGLAVCAHFDEKPV